MLLLPLSRVVPWRSLHSKAAVCRAMSTMKAITFAELGGTEVLRYSDVVKPVPGDGQVLIKNEFSGVNFIDTYFRTGLYPRQLPTGLGEEGAGVVEAVGPGVSHLKPGDRVCYITRSHLGGSYAQFTAVKADNVTVIPAGVTTEAAAAVMIQGDWVLVHAAAGGTGQLLVQICHNIGAQVIGTTSTQDKAEVARRCGCSEVILYMHEDVVERVQQITGGKGVKFVYDGVGKSTFDASLKCLDYLGWMISFGNASGKPEPFDVLRLGEKSTRLMRPSLFSTLASDPSLTHSLTAELMHLVATGGVAPQVHKVYELAQAGQAQDDLVARKTTGKLLLRPW